MLSAYLWPMEVESPGNLWVKRLHQPMSRRDVSIVLFETSVLLAPLQVMPELFELWRRTQEKRALWSSNVPIQRLVFVARSRRSSLSLILTQMDRRPKFWTAALEFLSRLVAPDLHSARRKFFCTVTVETDPVPFTPVFALQTANA